MLASIPPPGHSTTFGRELITSRRSMLSIGGSTAGSLLLKLAFTPPLSFSCGQGGTPLYIDQSLRSSRTLSISSRFSNFEY